MSESLVKSPAIQPVQEKPSGFLNPKTVDEALMIADRLSKSSMIPDEYRGKPDNILVALELGAEVGLGPMQSLQNISVIGQRPAIWGDAMLALVVGSGWCEDINEWFDDETKTAHCRVKRIDHSSPRETTFSFEDAKSAGLYPSQKKFSVWQTQPKRMAQMRARSFALRDVFPDVLKGIARLQLADERNVRDIKEVEKEKNVVLDDADYEEVPEEPVIDDETKSAMENIIKHLGAATTKQDMKSIQEHITELPAHIQPVLIDAWNTRKSMLTTKKPLPHLPASDLSG